MANVTETNSWPAGVYQYADGDVLDGGPDSAEVLPIKQLAQRSLFQRLANITAWDGVLASVHGYPNGACVMHAGQSWRSKIANNDAAPGSDALKWERWAFSLAELQAWFAEYLPFGAPVACPSTGPTGAANKAKIHKSDLGEYWMWLGDSWRVVSERASFVNSIASNALPGGVPTAIVNMTAPRAGRAVVRGILSALNASGVHTEMQAQIRRTRGAAQTLIEDSVGTAMTTLANQYTQARAYCLLEVQAGDVYHLMGTVSQAVAPSPLNASSIYIEYV